MTPSRLPLLVLIGGPPGSGKTTLARRLSEHLGVPWFSRDPFSRAIRLTEGVMPRPERSWTLWYRSLALLLDESASVVADQPLYRGVCEAEIEAHLLGRCRLRLIHCTSPDASERFETREAEQHGVDSDEYRRVLRVASDAMPFVSEPPDLGTDVLVVETSKGYQPEFAAIVRFCVQGWAVEADHGPDGRM